MKSWLRRIRGAIGMGLIWAVGWALAGLLIGACSVLLPGLPWDVLFRIFDAPLPALAIPGFVGGVAFSAVIGIAGRQRRFDELSLPRFGAWGAVGGLLLSSVPAAMTVVGLATPNASLWLITALISGPFALLGAASATASLALARTSEDRDLLDASEEVVEVVPNHGEARERLRDGT